MKVLFSGQPGYQQQRGELAEVSKINSCSVCGCATITACSDCQIVLRTTVYVCAKSICRDAHEKKCVAALQKALSEATAKLSEQTQAKLDAALERLKQRDAQIAAYNTANAADADVMAERYLAALERGYTLQTALVGHEELIKCCRDVHVYGATKEVIAKIIGALSAYDNSCPQSQSKSARET